MVVGVQANSMVKLLWERTQARPLPTVTGLQLVLTD